MTESSLYMQAASLFCGKVPDCSNFFLLLGSVESREHPSKQGKRWLSSAVSQPKEHRKGNSIYNGLF